MVDKYVYPGTNILVNKFNCRDEEKLKLIEALSTGGNLAWLQLHPVEGDFDFEHLKRIHHFIFQDLYGWAGRIRDVDIGKNNLFCRARFINNYAETVFGDFYSSCDNNKDNRDSFLRHWQLTIPAEEYADYQSKLTASLLILSEDD